MIVFNCTLELRDEKEVSNFIYWMKEQNTKVIDYTILPDTNELYEKDAAFHELIKQYKKVKTAKNKYIQENNHE